MPPWTRLTYLLPITSDNDRTAYLRILNYLRSRHPGSGHAQAIAGFTLSADDPAVFQGFYWSGSRWIDDEIVTLFIDFPGQLDDALLRQAKTIKAEIMRFYDEEGSPQQELWCVAESITLI